jgi:hypothetical protein
MAPPQRNAAAHIPGRRRAGGPGARARAVAVPPRRPQRPALGRGRRTRARRGRGPARPDGRTSRPPVRRPARLGVAAGHAAAAAADAALGGAGTRRVAERIAPKRGPRRPGHLCVRAGELPAVGPVVRRKPLSTCAACIGLQEAQAGAAGRAAAAGHADPRPSEHPGRARAGDTRRRTFARRPDPSRTVRAPRSASGRKGTTGRPGRCAGSAPTAGRSAGDRSRLPASELALAMRADTMLVRDCDRLEASADVRRPARMNAGTPGPGPWRHCRCAAPTGDRRARRLDEPGSPWTAAVELLHALSPYAAHAPGARPRVRRAAGARRSGPAHPAAEPPRIRRDPRRRGRSASSGTAGPSRCSCSTSTTSRASTTATATRRATRCCAGSPAPWPAASATSTPWPGSAARSSSCCCRRRPHRRRGGRRPDPLRHRGCTRRVAGPQHPGPGVHRRLRLS